MSLETTPLNYSIVNETLNILEGFGDSINSGAVNFLKQREDLNTHELVGLTDEEIQSIRDIWSGKTPVKHGFKTFKAEENYEGKAFVKIKAVGHKDIALMVDVGKKIEEPYQLGNSLMWCMNNKPFSFDTPINESMTIYADYLSQYLVNVHFVGITKQDLKLNLNYGETILMSRFIEEGYDMIALSDEGKEISKLQVTRDAFINIVYFKE